MISTSIPYLSIVFTIVSGACCIMYGQSYWTCELSYEHFLGRKFENIVFYLKLFLEMWEIVLNRWDIYVYIFVWRFLVRVGDMLVHCATLMYFITLVSQLYQGLYNWRHITFHIFQVWPRSLKNIKPLSVTLKSLLKCYFILYQY